MAHRLLGLSLGALGSAGLALAGAEDVPCNSSTGPDVVIGSLDDIGHYGELNGIYAYSIATNIVNVGDEILPWFPSNNAHPVIAQHMYKMNETRIEQIGISWVKHGFGALAWNDFNCGCQNPNNYDYLGVGCTDPYTAGLNGDQDGFGNIAGLGPRWEVNATTGVFPFPYTTIGQGGDTIYKRLQVHSYDLEPQSNPDTLYFAEGQYVTPDDAQAGHGANSLGYRPMAVGNWQPGAGWNLSLVGETVSGLPAIYAWAAAYPDVVLETVDLPDDGRFVLAARATENSDGSWHYEYAWHNINSWRSGRSLTIDLPVGATVSNAGWHAVDHHSGGPWSNEPWTITVDRAIDYRTYSADAGGEASPICWGTMANAWFDCDRGPGETEVTLGFYRTGTPSTVTVSLLGPVAGDDPGCVGDVNGNGSTEVNDLLAVLAVYGNTCTDCSEDIDDNGLIDVNDILALLADWNCSI
ncbi:MAG: hypothetical protein VX527_05825 [Planctomycetota bacterium]|nr:hypothetical protein [Planctomycetota bacterium]